MYNDLYNTAEASAKRFLCNYVETTSFCCYIFYLYQLEKTQAKQELKKKNTEIITHEDLDNL